MSKLVLILDWDWLVVRQIYKVHIWYRDISLPHLCIPRFDKSVIVRQGFEAKVNIWQSRIVKENHLILIGKTLKVRIECQCKCKC